MRKVTFPLMGHYTEAFEWMTKELGFEPVVPPRTTQETVKLGVRHSSDMVCYPFKVTLGNLIQGLDAGADTILATGVDPNPKKVETCRFLFYYHVQEQILRRMGYKFEMLYIDGNPLSIIKNVKRLNHEVSYLKAFRIVKETYKKIVGIEDEHYAFSKKKVNIGLVGEAYTLWAQEVNYDIINKIKKMGVGVDVSIKLSWFLKHQVRLADEKKYLHDEVKQYFPKRIGGHGWESLYNTIYYAKNGFDGVIHLLPLSCMPESMVEMSLNMISEDYKIPIYRFPIDENKMEVGFDTRLETFVKLLKRNKDA